MAWFVKGFGLDQDLGPTRILIKIRDNADIQHMNLLLAGYFGSDLARITSTEIQPGSISRVNHPLLRANHFNHHVSHHHRVEFVEFDTILVCHVRGTKARDLNFQGNRPFDQRGEEPVLFGDVYQFTGLREHRHRHGIRAEPPLF